MDIRRVITAWFTVSLLVIGAHQAADAQFISPLSGSPGSGSHNQFGSPFSLPMRASQSLYRRDSLRMAAQTVNIFRVKGLSPTFSTGSPNGNPGINYISGTGRKSFPSVSGSGKTTIPGMGENNLITGGASGSAANINTLLFPMSSARSSTSNSLLSGTPFLSNNRTQQPVTGGYSDSTYGSPADQYPTGDSTWNSW